MPSKQQQVQRVLIITLILNLLVAASKIVIGILSGALAITADGFHSIIDGTGNIVGLIATRLASRPPDDDHPYGHGRYETLAALLIGALLILTAWEVGLGALERLRSGETPNLTPLSFVVMIATLICNIFISRYQTRQGQQLESQILLADAANTRSDVFVTLSVLVSMALTATLGWGWADVVAALAVTALIARAGLNILRQTGLVLVDTAPYTPETLTAYIREVPSVGQIARVRSRGTRDDAYIDVSVQVDPAMTADQTAAIANAIRAQLMQRLPGIREVEVRFIPAPTTGPDYTLLVRAQADALALSAHEVSILEQPEGKVLEMHVEVTPDLTLEAAHHQVTQLESNLKKALPEIHEVITHIEPAAEHDEDNLTQRNETLEKRILALLEERYPGLDWHHVRVYVMPHGWTASMHVALPPTISVEVAHGLAEDAEITLRTVISDLRRITIHTEPYRRVSNPA